MSKLCERPGCSEPGAAAYGMVPEDLLFWIAAMADAPTSDARVLCRRHADAMVVPRGWTLDDRRDGQQPRLFRPRVGDATLLASGAASGARRRRARSGGVESVQLQIDGTGEIVRPEVPDPALLPAAIASPWSPEFDVNDDLDGLLEVKSPLLARAFRGTDRPRQ